MKIEQIRIDAFGGLEGYQKVLNPGLNSLLAENGFGKSTLAAFLRAMFYGLPPARPRKDLRDEERTKYAPWNGARMGGGLVIEWQGKHYRIERTFGAREKDDTLLVTDMDTGKVTDALGDVPGETIFRISREAFASTLLLTSESTASTTDGLDVGAPLQAELGSADPDPDMKNLPGALKRLEDAIRYYSRQGGRGHLAQMRDERTQLAADMRQIRVEYHELKQKETNDMARAQSGQGFVESEGSDFNYLEADADSTADIKDYTRILSDTQDLDDVQLTEEDLNDSKLMRKLTEEPKKKSHGKLIAVAVLMLIVGIAGAVYVPAARPPFVIAAGVGMMILAVLILTKVTTHTVDREDNISREQMLRSRQEENERAEKMYAEQKGKLKAQYAEKKKRVEQLTAQIEQESKRAEVYEQADKLLREAAKTAAEGARRLVSQHINEYLALFTDGNASEVKIDENFRISVLENGQERQLSYYSSGSQDLFRFAERLALLDGLYSREQPVLILDDPFVNLDDAHLEKVLAFLWSRQSQRQIIYLTCQSSRMP
ncbi:MAG: ATP-binding protein [Lachnospiraceae bacterium]